MSERIIVPIPSSPYDTRIEVYYEGELNRSGSVASGQSQASVKLPAAVEECVIKLIPCDSQGKPVGRGHIYEDGTLKPEPPENADPPAEPEEPCEEPCGECEGDCESSEIVAGVASEVSVERAEADEPVEEAELDAEDEDDDEEDDEFDFDDFDDEDEEDED